jgi:hypothetical protein
VAEGSQRKEVSHGACIFTELRGAAGVLEFVRENLRFPQLTDGEKNPHTRIMKPTTILLVAGPIRPLVWLAPHGARFVR